MQATVPIVLPPALAPAQPIQAAQALTHTQPIGPAQPQHIAARRTGSRPSMAALDTPQSKKRTKREKVSINM